MTDLSTGLLDKHGKEINVGDFVSLNGNMTTDDSLGDLPNGWFFNEEDVYEVYFDERIGKYSLKLGVEPDKNTIKWLLLLRRRHLRANHRGLLPVQSKTHTPLRNGALITGLRNRK